MPKLRVPKPKSLLLGSLALLSVPTGAWYVLRGSYGGAALWGLTALFGTLGLAIIYLLVRLFSRRGPRKAPSAPDPMDQQIGEAQRMLRAAGKGRGALPRLPAVIILGPSGSAKTTLVIQSDLNKEHLAGNLYSDGLVAPTSALNLWYHDDHVLVEAAGSIAADPERWSALSSTLRPRRFLAALLRRPQAPRVAVLCFNIDELLKPGADQAAIATATSLRARLIELSEQIGIRLPVYVIFTKSDSIPYFQEYVQNLTEDEVEGVLGTTLRAAAEASSDSYADRERDRITAAFEEIFHALAARRLDVLSRAGSQTANGAAYEFPREFRKITAIATRFLLELCRPNQLRVSPFLRGFYFAGVRPVVVATESPVVAQPQAASSSETPAGATQVFDAAQIARAQAQAAQQASQSHRRVPQWVFLGRILTRVVLSDQVAFGITKSGLGLTLLRRAAASVAIVLLMFVAVASFIGFTRERDFQGRVDAALAGVEGLSNPGNGLVPEEQLVLLDSLRQVTSELAEWETEGRPPRTALFMYTGSRYFPQLRAVYLERFKDLLWDRANRDAQDYITGLDSIASVEQYDRYYGALKVYVETFEFNSELDPDEFGRILAEHWRGEAQPDSSTMALARRQFVFFGEELRREGREGLRLRGGGPFASVPLDYAPARDTARARIQRNANPDNFYALLVGQFDGLPTGPTLPARFISPDSVVPGVFTAAGWDSVHATLSDPDAFTRDAHVVVLEGTEGLADTLRSRYQTDYRERWIGFLEGASLNTPSLRNGGADWLGALATNESALFQALTQARRNVDIGNPVFRTIFGSVLTLTDSSGTRLFSDQGSAYLETLSAVGVAVGGWSDDLSNTQGVRDAAGEGVQLINTLALEFPTEPPEAQRAGSAVSSLLRRPFEYALSGIAGSDAEIQNDRARTFCNGQQTLLSSFPFAAEADRTALWADVDAFLAPDGSADAFIAEIQGSGLPTTGSFQRFRDRIRQLQTALYQAGGDGAGLRMQIQVADFGPLSELRLRVDLDEARFTRGDQDTETLSWVPSTTDEVRMDLSAEGGTLSPIVFGGPWGPLRLFHEAEWSRVGNSQWRVSWTHPDGPRFAVTLRLQVDIPVLQRGFFSGLACPRTVAQ